MEEGAALDDGPPDDASEGESEFVEVDPSGRYGRVSSLLFFVINFNVTASLSF